MSYTVWSKSKSGSWVIERSSINKGTNRRAKVVVRGRKP